MHIYKLPPPGIVSVERAHLQVAPGVAPPKVLEVCTHLTISINRPIYMQITEMNRGIITLIDLKGLCEVFKPWMC